MTNPETAERYRLRQQDLVWRTVDEETVILDLRESSYLALNASAGFLWQQLDDGRSEAELVQALARTYDLDDETAVVDVREFLGSCMQRGLIDRA